MKMTFAIAALGLVAGANAAQVHLKVNTASELAGTFKAEDGTVMHFQSTPAGLKLADANMVEFWNAEGLNADHDTESVEAMIQHASEYSSALTQEGPLAEQFQMQMSAFDGLEEEDEELVEEEAQWGRRRRRRRRHGGANSGVIGQVSRLTNYLNCCGQHRHCDDGRGRPNGNSHSGRLDRACATHDQCLADNLRRGGGGGAACDATLCAFIKRGGYCRWYDAHCKTYSAAARFLMCKGSNSPNAKF